MDLKLTFDEGVRRVVGQHTESTDPDWAAYGIGGTLCKSPIGRAVEKADIGRAKKLGELTAITSSWEQTEFVMKTGVRSPAMARHRG